MQSRIWQIPQIGDPSLARAIAQLAVFTGLAGLLASKLAAGTALAVLSVLGIALLIRPSWGRPWDKNDWEMVLLLSILPLAYAFNMVLLGWDFRALDEPSRLLLAALAFVTLRSLPINANMIFWACLLGVMVAAIMAYQQTYIANLPRAHGITHPIPFGNISLLLAAIVFGGWNLLFDRVQGRKLLPWVILAIMAGLWASLASGSRGGWIALPLFAYILSLSLPKVRIWHRACVLAIITTLMIGSYYAAPSVQQRIDPAIHEAARYFASPNPHNADLGSFGYRLEMWHVGLETFRDSPWLGAGFTGFNQRLQAGISEGAINPELGHHAHLHNEIITTAAKLGILGLGALFIFWLGLWRQFGNHLKNTHQNRELRFFALIGLLTVGGFALFSLSDSMFGTFTGIHAQALLLAIAAGGVRTQVVSNRT